MYVHCKIYLHAIILADENYTECRKPLPNVFVKFNILNPSSLNFKSMKFYS